MVVENAAYEFTGGAAAMLVLVGGPRGARVRAARTAIRDTPLQERADVDMVMQNGVPLPLLIGIEGARQDDRPHGEIFRPAGNLDGAGGRRAARQLGLKKVALVNKWSDETARSAISWRARVLGSPGWPTNQAG